MDTTKISTPQNSGNSTPEVPAVSMELGHMAIEIACSSDFSDGQLMGTANEIRKRYNLYPRLVAFIQHLGQMEGGPELEDFIANNYEDVMEDENGEAIEEDIPFLNNPDIFDEEDED
jgi:hypothetical protein